MESSFIIRKNCAGCGSADLFKFLDLGSSPLADKFVDPEKADKPEQSFPLQVAACRKCRLAQLLHLVNDSLLFGDDYAFFTSASPQAVIHFRKYAEEVIQRFPDLAKKLVVEVASNDGVLLRPLKEHGAKVLGIEPSHNIAPFANAIGIPTVEKFFNSKTAEEIKKEHGFASLLIANNVVAHIQDLHDFMEAAKSLLSPDGVFIFEVQYFPNLLFKNQFDHVYHEHRFFFSLFPINQLLKKIGFEIFDVEEVDTQGGSLRIFAGHKGKKNITPAVGRILHNEDVYGMADVDTYSSLQSRALFIKTKLSDIFENLKAQGKKIVGYGAPAKGNTLLNYCNIGPKQILYIIDRTLYKHGKLTPGMHIPVYPTERILEDGFPDYYFLLVWNYAPAMLLQEEAFRKQGGKFIIPIPAPEII